MLSRVDAILMSGVTEPLEPYPVEQPALEYTYYLLVAERTSL